MRLAFGFCFLVVGLWHVSEPAKATTYPYGALSIPYLTEHAQVIGIVGDSKPDVSKHALEVRLDKILLGPLATPKTLSVVSEDPLNPGDLVFLVQLENESKSKADWIPLSGHYGIYKNGSSLKTAALDFLQADSDEKKAQWALAQLKKKDDSLNLSAEIQIAALPKSLLGDELIQASLDAFAPDAHSRYLSSAIIHLSETRNREVGRRLAEWAETQTLSATARVFAIDLLVKNNLERSKVDAWMSGDEGEFLQNASITAWMNDRSLWTDDREKDYEARLSSPDPRVRILAVEELAQRNFYHSSRPFRLVKNRLLDTKELPVVKRSMIQALARATSGCMEAAGALKAFILDPDQSYEVRKSALGGARDLQLQLNQFERNLIEEIVELSKDQPEIHRDAERVLRGLPLQSR